MRRMRIVDLFVPRVDAVSRPANRRKFLLMKEEVSNVEETLEKALTEEQKEAVKEALEKLYPLFEEGVLSGNLIAALGALVGYPAPEGVKPYPYPYPKPYPKPYYPYPKTSAAKTVEGSGAEASSEGTTETASLEDVQALIKKAVEEARKEWEAQEKAKAEELAKSQARLAELEKALALEKEARERDAFLAHANETYPQISKLLGEKQSVLFELKKSAGEESWKALEDLFARLNKMLVSSPLLKELGSGATTEESPEEKLEKKARELLEKGLAPTIEQARVRAALSDRALYEELRKGR